MLAALQSLADNGDEVFDAEGLYDDLIGLLEDGLGGAVHGLDLAALVDGDNRDVRWNRQRPPLAHEPVLRVPAQPRRPPIDQHSYGRGCEDNKRHG